MKRDAIDRLLQLAYLEGAVRTRNAYERAALKRKPSVAVSEEKRLALQRKLEQAMGNQAVTEVRALTIGALLRRIRAEQSLRPPEVFSRLGLSSNHYQLLERDRISPPKISVDVWRRMRTLLNIPVEEFSEMVRRTHQLVFFRPAFRTTLARYDGKKNKAMKASTLEKATAELYAKAKLELPVDEKAKIEKLLKSIAAG